MCNLYLEGVRGILDMAKCPYEFASPEFLNLHLKDLSTIEQEIKILRYEEEIVIELDEQKTRVLTEYAEIIRQVEVILLKDDIYGLSQDPEYNKRKKVLRSFYEYMFLNPVMAVAKLEEYNEPTPEKSIFMKGYQTFKAWNRGIMKRVSETKLYELVKKTGDLRTAFLSLTGLKSLYFVNSVVLEIPPNAVKLEDNEASYELSYGNQVQIYEIPGEDAYLYNVENKIIKNLSQELSKMLSNVINENINETYADVKDFNIMYNLKAREYRQYFMDYAMMNKIKITPQEAMVMGIEAASWTVGLGSPIETLSLDKENITDIYIDSENSPLYIEHAKYGICHTLFRYNRDLLERAFVNGIKSLPGKKFDSINPIADIVIKRLSMRCHVQRPPATFEELQGALRIMKEAPFTYSQYLYFKSISPFFAGYDDVMVGLGCSEAVLGLKGVGKTSFTASKISAIGTRRRIIPIQDIEEIPVRAFRKRGFHIGTSRVQSSDIEVRNSPGGELDLVSMANALLRMGDAAIIINEVRSRTSVQGIINLLNTQPGVFLLYNLHAESLRDIQDRLELVFGIPAASMFATDRYTFLKKIKFGRRGATHRVLGFEYESDLENKKFVEVFKYKRDDTLEKCVLEPKFIKNKETMMYDLSSVDFAKFEKELDIKFIPPALVRRSEESGVAPEQYIVQMMFKGKIYDDIYRASEKTKDPILREIDFVVRCNTYVNKMLASLENENGEIDFAQANKLWEEQFKILLREELALRKKD